MDVDDIGLLAENWLVDLSLPGNGDYLLDDFESYDPVDPNIFTRWTLVDDPDVDAGITLLTDAADAHSGSKAMRLTWQEIVDESYAAVILDVNDVITGLPDLSHYDQFSMWIYRHDYDHQILIVDPLDEAGQSLQSVSVTLFPDSTTLPYGKWAQLVINLNYDTPTPVSGFLIRATTNYDTEPGTLDIDDIWLIKLPDCPDAPVGDVNGDCKVDLLDLAIMSSNWLEGTVW